MNALQKRLLETTILALLAGGAVGMALGRWIEARNCHGLLVVPAAGVSSEGPR